MLATAKKIAPSVVLEEQRNSLITLNTPVLGSSISYGELFTDPEIATKHQQPIYDNPQQVIQYMCALSEGPALTSRAEIVALKEALAEVQQKKGYVIHAGLCAENIDTEVEPYARKFVKMMTGLRGEMQTLNKPVVTIGRYAGQFAKPRSSAFEEHEGMKYPAFRGTNVNGLSFEDRTPSILRMMKGNVFASQALTALEKARKKNGFHDKIYASHEALHLANEIGYLRRDTEGHLYAGSAPMIWIGDRTNDPEGLHVRLAGMVENPIGLKIGPGMAENPRKLDKVLGIINPRNEAGKVLPILRLGKDKVATHALNVIDALLENGIEMVIADPMHGNGLTDKASKKKYRLADDINAELMGVADICAAKGMHLAGVSLEVSGDNVTEVVGFGVNSFHGNYQTLCDACYNPSQAGVQVRLLANKLAPMINPAWYLD